MWFLIFVLCTLLLSFGTSLLIARQEGYEAAIYGKQYYNTWLPPWAEQYDRGYSEGHGDNFKKYITSIPMRNRVIFSRK